jgi:hypothetical protein
VAGAEKHRRFVADDRAVSNIISYRMEGVPDIVYAPAAAGAWPAFPEINSPAVSR